MESLLARDMIAIEGGFVVFVGGGKGSVVEGEKRKEGEEEVGRRRDGYGLRYYLGGELLGWDGTHTLKACSHQSESP